jgi:hypothetical protein
VPPGAPGVAGLAAARPGDCATWDQGARTPTARIVPCSAPHLAEVVAATTVTGLGSSWPGPARFAAYAAQVCPTRVAAYLGHPLDPQGLVASSAAYPTADEWRTGGRTLVCDLVRRRAGAASTLAAFTGRVAGDAPLPLFPAGTCLEDVGAGAAAVACSRPHQVEVTGDATAPAGAPLPTSPTGWQPLVGAACAADAQRWLGAPPGLGVASGWLPVPPASWAAGRRLVTCLVGRQLDDGGWEVSTGSLRGSGR